MESLDHGGLLVVATDSPLPEDTHDNRDRFLRLHKAYWQYRSGKTTKNFFKSCRP